MTPDQERLLLGVARMLQTQLEDRIRRDEVYQSDEEDLDTLNKLLEPFD